MQCVNVRGKPFEGFEIQNQRTSFLLLWSVFYFYILKLPLSTAQLCPAVLSAQPKLPTGSGLECIYLIHSSHPNL